MTVCVGITNGVSDCVSEQELAAVKTDMQRQVDELHSQLHYWQNTTIKILKEHYFPPDPGIYENTCAQWSLDVNNLKVQELCV